MTPPTMPAATPPAAEENTPGRTLPVTFFTVLTKADARMSGLAGHQGRYDSLPLSIP
jgi:hypothetical protein